MKINSYQFQLLSKQAQIAVICNRGVYLTTHETGSFIIDRYQVDHFYVEIFYSQTNQGVIINSYYSLAADGTLLDHAKSI